MSKYNINYKLVTNKYGPQYYQEKENKRLNGDPLGFCSAWNIWLLDVILYGLLYRTSNSIMSIIDDNVQVLRKKGNITEYIRNYISSIY